MITEPIIRKGGLLILSSALIGFLAALIATTIKISTEHYEHILYNYAIRNTWPIFVLPLVALMTITLLRQFLFKSQPNKGIKEINTSIKETEDHLPAYKIPSHSINGFLTVISGGSTGIEVSTVVASATLGSIASQRKSGLSNYKKELICAGIAAGVTALFNAPLAGLLFVYEVFSKKLNSALILCVLTATTVAYLLTNLAANEPLFHFNVSEWHFYAIPYFILLGILAGVNSVYLTKCVIFFKNASSAFENNYIRVFCFSILISAIIYFVPQLYGDGYLAINHLTDSHVMSINMILSLLFIILLKPVITSITLSAGGDGGVFAPSLFLGAFLGAVTAMLLNHFFHADVIVLNFMVIGMAAVLSASIHAPFTSVFLVCGLIGNFYLIIPLLIGSFISKLTAEKLVPYTVYSYNK